MGLEPTNGGTTIHCLNHLATLAIPSSNYNMLYFDLRKIMETELI